MTHTKPTRVVFCDTETDLIGQPDVVPQLVCSTWTERDLPPWILGSSESDLAETETLLRSLLTDESVRLVFHNAGFDVGVFMVQFPGLIPAFFEAAEEGRLDDTGIREKLLNLSTHGHISYAPRPDGSNVKLFYGLADLVMKYTGQDRSASKTGDDIWRLNYIQLLGVPTAEYPKEALEYALTDVQDTCDVYYGQEARIEGDRGRASVTVSPARAALSVAFQLMTAWGLKVSQERVEQVDSMLREELSDEKLDLLIAGGFLVPAQPERPYANGAKNPDGTPKMAAAKKPALKMKLLQGYVKDLCQRLGIPVKMTDPSERNPEGQVSLDGEVQTALAPFDPLMKQFQHRQVLNKLVTDFMPKLRISDTIHPQFGVLVDSGRTSSSASDKFPSCNGQQVDPRVRQCFVARPGTVLIGADYSAIELAAFGQTTYELFGYSTHRDLINEGYDLHSYLAAQLLTRLPLDPAFTAKHLAGTSDPRELHDKFKAIKQVDPTGYGKWRQFAKAPGFGLPGGMGVNRFQEFCRKDYGVDITLDEATNVKQVWLDTYPEAKDYFAYVKQELRDPCNVGRDAETGEPKPKFAYSSPMGMYRAGCDYCSAANGMGFQTRTAEGAVAAVFKLVRECYDPTRESVLYGSHVVLFIHDEIIIEAPLDEKTHERAMRVQQVMVDCMKITLPDVKVEAEPLLMLEWNKKAEPKFDENGRLQIWTPDTETE